MKFYVILFCLGYYLSTFCTHTPIYLKLYVHSWSSIYTFWSYLYAFGIQLKYCTGWPWRSLVREYGHCCCNMHSWSNLQVICRCYCCWDYDSKAYGEGMSIIFFYLLAIMCWACSGGRLCVFPFLWLQKSTNQNGGEKGILLGRKILS